MKSPSPVRAWRIGNCGPVFTALAILFAAVTPVHAQTTQAAGMRPMPSVFQQQRSDKEDVIYVRNKDVLRGELLNKSLSIITQYGEMTVPLDRCAGISFEGSRANTEAIVTCNYNRITGIIKDRLIRFKIGTSGSEMDIRKEKIQFILRRRTSTETDFADSAAKTNLFVMANGDLLTGHPANPSFTIRTDYGELPLSFAEIANVEMQGGGNVTAVVKKKNGDVMRGTLVTEEMTVKLDLGFAVDAIYKDKFSKIYVDDGTRQVLVQFGVQQPVAGESDGALTQPPPPPGDAAGFTNSVGMRFVFIQPGKFWMGDADASPRHSVRITNGFFLGVTEVTQGQWTAVMETQPWSGQKNVQEGDDNPAVYISWEDAVAFCKKLSEKEGKAYRLPTEAEWEYACRAGTTTLFSFGDNEKDLGTYAWYDGNADSAGAKYAHKVGLKKPNPWGLFDMQGNVWEWCSDWYGPYPENPVDDPKGPSDGKCRVLRGGSWFSYHTNHCKPASRDSRILYLLVPPKADQTNELYNTWPSLRLSITGFRVSAGT